jgi:RNA polymerase sigma-70 factor, ECF subfamily
MKDSKTLYDDHHNELKGFIYSRVKNREVTNDLLQDVFIKVHLNLPSLKEETSVRSWIYSITNNIIIDYFRKQKSERGKLSDTALISEDEERVNDMSVCVLPMVNKLPSRYKQALLDVEIARKSQKEFAHQLKISYSGAKSRVQRAREMLRKEFENCCKIVADKYGNIISGEPKNSCECR